jgi:hypothetical protein
VSKINEGEGAEHAALTYLDKRGASRVVWARSVLVTMSVGVLKADTINFVLGLSRKKHKTISTMGFH